MTVLEHYYQNLSIQQKLRLIILFSVMVALLLAGGAILTYDQLASRSEMRDDLYALAEILGSNSTAALTFGDGQAAEELLLGLRTKKNVIRSLIYSADGSILAEYGGHTARVKPAL